MSAWIETSSQRQLWRCRPATVGNCFAMRKARMSAALLVEIMQSIPVLTRKDLARRYGVSERTIDRMRADGTLPKPKYLHGPFWRPIDIAQAESEDRV